MLYVSRYDRGPEFLFYDSSKYDPALRQYSTQSDINEVLARARSCLGLGNKLNPIAGIKDNRFVCTQLRFGLEESSDAVNTLAPSLHLLVSRTSNPTAYLPGATSRPNVDDDKYNPYNGTSAYAQNVVLTGRMSGQTYYLPYIGHRNPNVNPNYANYALYNVVTYGRIGGWRSISNSRTPNQYMANNVLYTVQFTATSDYLPDSAYISFGGKNQIADGGGNYPVYVETTGLTTIVQSGANETVSLDCFIASWNSNTFYKFDSSTFSVDQNLMPGSRPTVAFRGAFEWKQRQM